MVKVTQPAVGQNNAVTDKEQTFTALQRLSAGTVVTGNTTSDTLSVNGLATLKGALDHDGANIGFFGVAPAIRQGAFATVLNAPALYDQAHIQSLVDAVHSLRQSLRIYGLLS